MARQHSSARAGILGGALSNTPGASIALLPCYVATENIAAEPGQAIEFL
jgi:hypothetical protein